MKRAILSIFLLATGAALGGGGLYLGLHWERYNPFRHKTAIAAKSLVTKLHIACATDDNLKGAYIKSAEPADGKLVLRGWANSKEQLVPLQAKCRALFFEHPDLVAKFEAGLSTDGLKVVPLFGQLSRWQREFEEFKGVEKIGGDNDLKREAMRTTRLDGIAFAEDGKLIISGVCVRGDRKMDATGNVLLGLLQSRIEAAVTPELTPEFAIDMRYFANPVVTLQNKLNLVEQAKNVRMVSAFYDGKGKLHLEALVTHEDQRKFIDEALDGLLKDPQILPMVALPSAGEAVPDFVLRAVIFDGESSARELQKKIVEHARKEKKPLLRHVRLANVLPTAMVDEKKEIVTDEEGNPRYYFRVTGRLLETPGTRKQLEDELIDWLTDELPRMLNPNQTPIDPRLDMVVRPSPVFALQAFAVQRGLDGAAFTDALFDETGKLEIRGRLHQPGDDSKKVLETIVTDLLAEETPWSLSALKPHEASKDGTPLAWNAAVRECQTKLASDNAMGRRLRLDRLYFNYVNNQMRLITDGVFLADNPGEDPSATITKGIDAIVLSRGKANVSSGNLKSIKNPLAELQTLLTERSDLDGALLTQARYDVDGRFHLDGYLAQAEHKAALTPLLGDRLASIPELLKKGTEPAWSLDGMKPHAAAKGEWKWPDLLRAHQSELAAAPEALFQRTCLARAFFQYVEPKTPVKNSPPRQLTLRYQAICLLKPTEKIDTAPLIQAFDAAGRRLLPSVPIDRTDVDLQQTLSPIVELQKWAIAERHDGVFFKDAFYDRDGKLVLAGLYGSAEQVKHLKEKTSQLARSVAPWGLADLDKMRLSPWQSMLEDLRTTFAGEKQALFKQTRIDRAYFEHDATGVKAQVRFEGICIYKGTASMPEQDVMLKKQLQTKGVEGFELNVAGIERKINPVIEMQKKAIDAGMDGVVFSQIGFDAKGACYIRLPLVPAGQEGNIRKLIDEAAKGHPYLGGIQQR